MKKALLILGLGWALTANALVQVHDLTEPTLRFYRSPQSSFPSGEAAQSVLQEKLIGTRNETLIWVKSEQKKDWMLPSQLYYLRDFLRQTIHEQSAFLTQTSDTLRHIKDWRSAPPLKAGTALTLTQFRSDWSCGFDLQGPLCVPTSKVILPIDAAKQVQDRTGQWHPVKQRRRHMIITEKGQQIPINSLRAWEANPNIAFVRPFQELAASTQEPNFAPFSKVTLLNKEIRRWNQSILPDHGNVWWRAMDLKKSEIAPIVLSREELEGRPVYDQSTNGHLSIIAAQGIFISKDQEAWTLLRNFEESNFPVAIGPRNTLVVGDKISFDEGKTFQSYLRWDEVTLQTQKNLGHTPKHLRITKIRTSGRASLQLQIDTGYKLVTFDFNMVNSHLTLLQTSLRK